MQRTFQRTDRTGNCTVRVGSAGGQRAADEGRVVAAAVLGMNHHHHVEKVRLFFRVAGVRANHAQEVLRRGKLRARIVDMQRFSVKIVAVHRVGICHNCRERANELDGLREQIVCRRIIRVFIVGIQQQHAPRQIVHDVPARVAHDHAFGEAFRELPGFAHDIIEIGKLRFCRQVSHQKQVRDLLVAERSILAMCFDDFVEINAAVIELAWHGHAPAVFDQIALDAADLRHTDQNAGSVAVPKPALDLSKVIAVGNLIFLLDKAAEGRCHIRSQIHCTFHDLLLLPQGAVFMLGSL